MPILKYFKQQNQGRLNSYKLSKNILVPCLIFSVLYFLYFLSLKLSGILVIHRPISGLVEPLWQWFIGAPYYHMWYMYMVIGLYLIVPILIRLKKCLGQIIFERIAFVVFILGIISGWTSDHLLYWDIGLQSCYLGYFLMGAIIYEHKNEKKRIPAWLLIVTGLLIEILTFIARIQLSTALINNLDRYSLVMPLSPLVALSSVLICCGFATLKVEKRHIVYSAIANISVGSDPLKNLLNHDIVLKNNVIYDTIV